MISDDRARGGTEPKLATLGLTLNYGSRIVVEDLDLAFPDQALTVIVGPNACGKSTLLRGLSKVLRPERGTALLDGTSIQQMRAKELARQLGMLPQSAVAPETITVLDLVGRGRYPHQSFLRQWSTADHQAVARAMAITHTSGLAHRDVDELSGGQRQRVWLAMVLAQETSVLLLDEPTTFLDIAHQYEVLDLCAELRDDGYTLVVVLHDLNQAARYADHLIVMADGAVVAAGPPAEVVTPELVADVFGLACSVVPDPRAGTPLVVPAPREVRRRRSAAVDADGDVVEDGDPGLGRRVLRGDRPGVGD